MPSQSKVILFCLDISECPQWALLITGIIGIFSSFILQGTSQEQLYTKYNYKESIFFTLVQFTGYFSLTLPFFIGFITGKIKLKVPFTYYMFTSTALCCSMLFSNLSVERLTYPTAVLFKSSKLIPVMIGRMIFLKKKYTLLEIFAVCLMVCGLIGISISDKKSKNKFDITGVLLSSLSLIADSIASNFQEKALREYNASQNEVISMLYFIGMCYLTIVSLATGQMQRGVSLAIKHPDMILYLSIFGLLGAIGVQFVYMVMGAFGSLVTVMVTSCRKAMTVCLSFILFPKKFTRMHLLSILLIGFSIGLTNIAGRRKEKEAGIEKDESELTPFLHNKSILLPHSDAKLV